MRYFLGHVVQILTNFLGRSLKGVEKVLGGHLLPRQPLGEYNALLSRYQTNIFWTKNEKGFCMSEGYANQPRHPPNYVSPLP